jgi:hypothetical protein
MYSVVAAAPLKKTGSGEKRMKNQTLIDIYNLLLLLFVM